MWGFISSIREASLLRLKSPLIGAFFFSWFALNINGIALFIMVDMSQRIEMVKGKSWFFVDDVVYPFIIASCYLVFLPLLHLLYDVFDSFVSVQRFKINEGKTFAQIQAEPNNIKTKHDHALKKLIEEKSNLEEQVFELVCILEVIKEGGFSIADEKWVHPLERLTDKMRNTVDFIKSARI
jgi:hypothetical protein